MIVNGLSKFKICIFTLIGCICIIGTANTGEFYSKKIIEIQSPDKNRPCTFIRFEGVTNVDSTGSDYVGIPQNHPSYKEMLAIFISAKLTDRPVHFATNGTVVSECSGVAEVAYVRLP